MPFQHRPVREICLTAATLLPCCVVLDLDRAVNRDAGCVDSDGPRSDRFEGIVGASAAHKLYETLHVKVAGSATDFRNEAATRTCYNFVRCVTWQHCKGMQKCAGIGRIQGCGKAAGRPGQGNRNG